MGLKRVWKGFGVPESNWHVPRSTMRGFSSGGGGGGIQVRLTKKKVRQRFFFSPQLILQKSNGQFQ